MISKRCHFTTSQIQDTKYTYNVIIRTFTSPNQSSILTTRGWGGGGDMLAADR